MKGLSGGYTQGGLGGWAIHCGLSINKPSCSKSAVVAVKISQNITKAFGRINKTVVSNFGLLVCMECKEGTICGGVGGLTIYGILRSHNKV